MIAIPIQSVYYLLRPLTNEQLIVYQAIMKVTLYGLFLKLIQRKRLRVQSALLYRIIIIIAIIHYILPNNYS